MAALSLTYIHGCTDALGRKGTIDSGFPLSPVATFFTPIVEFHADKTVPAPLMIEKPEAGALGVRSLSLRIVWTAAPSV
jgi:hypothetical protein